MNETSHTEAQKAQKTACIFWLLLVSLTATVQAQTSLDDHVKPIVASFKGKVSLFAKNLDTGETYALNADERVRTASTIKIAIMIEAFARVAEG